MPQGNCKLCLKNGELLDSHYLPKSVYAGNRAKTLKNPNPVTLSHGQAKQKSDQLRGPTLCKDCEDRFNKNGEKWVMARLPHDYKAPFPLQDALIPATPAVFGDNVNIYEGRTLAAFDMDQITYFGLSIFWRGACREWKSTNGAVAPPVDLGKYYEPIRHFLLGGPFPQGVHLVILIHNQRPVGNAALPVMQAQGGYGIFYWFSVNGLGFMLYLGDDFPKEAEAQCAQHGVNGPVVVDRAFSNMVHSYFRELLDKSTKSEGVVSLIKAPQNSPSDIGK